VSAGPIEILVIDPISDGALAQIAEVDPDTHVVDARGWFDGEIRATWPPWTVQRYLGDRPSPDTTRNARDNVLERAEIILGGFPFPLDLRARSPRLRWFHQRPAGASNLLRGDLWGSDVVVTTSRGHGNVGPMAEYVLACFLHFGRGFHQAEIDRQRGKFDHRAYHPVAIAGKTICVVGTGGIGRLVGKLCAGAGMRVVGTRRGATENAPLPEGFAHIGTADELLPLLHESAFVAVCCPWTRETTHLIGAAAFEAMPAGAVLVNVARGEIVDENALIDALAAGRLRGVGLDVYEGEFERGPDPRLWQDSRVLITPHVSGASDVGGSQALALFEQNLRAYLHDRPLANIIDWERGY
jgi:phosphoglycerate dehydrogenase-like enzyme